ncbi:MAG: SRPBCC domain-containing protein [Actinomycetota bacterium]
MLHFETTTTIDAPPERVWTTLLQTDQWPAWGAGIERVDGRLGPDQKLTLHVAEASRPFKLRVSRWQPGQRIELKGGMPLGLFVGTRTYRIEPGPAGTDQTIFTMVETFTGPLAGLIGRTIPDLQPSFDAFAAGLRSTAQASNDESTERAEGEHRG